MERLNEATQQQDTENIRLLNHQFHFFFYERCGIPALSDEIEDLWRAFPWDMMLSAPEPSYASEVEHSAILDAVKAGDPDRAAEALEVHIRRSFTDLAERITGKAAPDPFDIDND
ncbi:FCD domain-containing protein [Arthrobacter sp. SD76]|uniref:FCD domain-containing protein n=1 Tax=Arthrobacter sp. SD76 TaxID=3415007 RepID=UPI003C7703FF